MVNNPDFKTKGDFSLQNGVLQCGDKYAFSGISVINPWLFDDCEAGYYSISSLFEKAIIEQKVSSELFFGAWYDIGIPQRLAMVQKYG